MEYRFIVTQFVSDYVKIGDEYKSVEVKNKYEVTNYDDLQNLLLTLIDFGAKETKFSVRKEEVSE